MAIPTAVAEALTRLTAGNPTGYNNSAFNASTNPYGFGDTGHRVNLYGTTNAAGSSLTADYNLVNVWFYSELEPLTAISSDIEAVGNITSEVTTLAALDTELTALAAVADNIPTLAAIVADISTVAGISTEVGALGALATEIAALYAIRADISAVYAIVANVSAVAAIDGNVSTVATIAAHVTTVAGNVVNISAVAAINGAVSTVAAINSNVTTVANNIVNVGIVSGINAAVSTTADAASAITTVSTNIGNVNTTAGSVVNINLVANGLTNINLVADDLTNINAVAGDLTAIQGASAAASAAAANASAAQGYALAAQRVTTFFVFDSATTDADPGVGKYRLNHATISSVTVMYVSLTELAGGDVTAWLSGWDSSTNTANRGEVSLIDADNAGAWAKFIVSGASVSATGYLKIAVTHVSSHGTFVASNEFGVGFTRTGNKGTDGDGAGDVVGPESAADTRLVVFDGATGKLLADSGVGIADVARLSAAQAYTSLRTFKTTAKTIVAHGTVSSGTEDFDISDGDAHTITAGGAFTLTTSSWPSGSVEIDLHITDGGANITWPTIHWAIGDGTTSTSFASMGVTLASSGLNTVVLWSVDGGTTIFGAAS